MLVTLGGVLCGRNAVHPTLTRIASKHWLGAMKRVVIAVAAFISLVIAVALSSPDKVVIDEILAISDPINHVRAFAQGERFWQTQRSLIEKELAWYAAAPEREEALSIATEKVQEALKRAETSMEKVYARMPESRPTPAQQEAKTLRRQADKIEAAETHRIIDDMTAKRVVRLRLILAALAQREQ